MKKLNLFLLSLFMAVCSIVGVTSCNNEDSYYNENESSSDVMDVSKETLLNEFAKILSKTVYTNREVREFLKKESIRQFDKNYDVLYAGVKDKVVGSNTFRSILIENSSKEFIENIEKYVPQLNIFFSNISMFDINAENYNCDDAELPVAVSNTNETSLYFNGICANKLQKGEVPCFHTLVVNENERVIVNKQTRGNGEIYTFISPNFDNTRTTRAINLSPNGIGRKALEAALIFNKNDNSSSSKALQRDYVYYGMTPTSTQGAYDHNSREYITYIKVNPTSYFQIADVQEDGENSTDPYVKNFTAERKVNDFTEAELIDIMWTKGAYNFRIEVAKSTQSQPEVLMVPLKPEELWNFNMDRNYRHSTTFRHSKYTYKIDPRNFTAKRHYFSKNLLSLGKWNLAQESLTRYIHIQEVDPSQTIESVCEYEWTKVSNSKFKGEVKLSLGLGDGSNLNGEIGSEITNTNTTREKTTVKVTRETKSDDLGGVTIYFYDPLVEVPALQPHEYNTGTVCFGITAY